jgi:phosphoribosylformylglycinamidine synthase
VIHPRRTARRVVAGVRDYGNRMGVPTVNGAVFFDSRYIGNPLVFCGSVGLLPIDRAQKGAARKGDRIVVLGGRTGRDGIHGATFSSDVLTDKHGEQFSHAVQIGNAITEKKMLDVILAARDNPGGSLFHAITDCGAGGLSSAVGEMGSETGAAVHLDRAPLKYDGLSYAEIWISEAQERMVLAVQPDRLAALKSLAARHDVEAIDIGEFDGSGRLTLYYRGEVVGDMDMHFIHEGLPKPVRKAIWEDPTPPSVIRIAPPADLGRALHELLSAPTIASKHWIIRQYDHEVQGGTVIKPLVGPRNSGPGDAAVIMPVADSQKAAALAVGCQPRFGDLNPYQMALNSIDEAIRNIVCVGGNPQRIALLDNFCWPKCSDRIHLGALVRACQACYDGAIAFRTPFISGKDSLSNEFITEDGTRICIPYTLLISAIGVVDDVARCITMDAKKPGHRLVLVGITRRELGGSHYLMLQNHLGRNVPTVDLAAAPNVHRAVGRAISRGLVRSAHDLSEGGLGVAVAEMLLAGGLGARIKLSPVISSEDAREDHVLLFSETPTRYLLEVAPSHLEELQSVLGDIPMADIGELTRDPRLIIESLRNEVLIDESVEALEESWHRPLDW